MLVGEQVTKFWYGEKYIFERTDSGLWKCVHKDNPIIPQEVITDLYRTNP
jgi:hypothetical protein